MKKESVPVALIFGFFFAFAMAFLSIFLLSAIIGPIVPFYFVSAGAITIGIITGVAVGIYIYKADSSPFFGVRGCMVAGK